MTANDTDLTEERIVLGSLLPEIERLPAWVDALAAQHGIGDRTKFAINLCLEEAVSNVVRHSARAMRITLSFSEPRAGHFLFTIDDDAPRFDPLALPPLPSMDEHVLQQPAQVGGQGIRLMRAFAQTLAYEATPRGNRLTIGFENHHPAEAEQTNPEVTGAPDLPLQTAKT